MDELISTLEQIGIVPVVVIERVEDALPLASALVEGGLSCAEVTFRTPHAAEAIRLMTSAYPEMLVGAGTVLTPEQADEAKAAGARFIVAPGLNPRVVEHVHSIDLPMIPGVCTPSDIERALELGLDHLKFFPAEQSGGLAMIKALSGPYHTVRFMPTGGINPGNVRDYLSFGKVFCCGGTWFVNKRLLSEGRFDEIKWLVHEAAQIVHVVRG